MTSQLCLVAAKSLAKIGLSSERNGNLFTVFYSKIKQKKTYFYDLLKKKRMYDCQDNVSLSVKKEKVPLSMQ